MKYFSSDWHLGHCRILEMSDRPFVDIDVMNSVIVENMTKPLKSGDIFYFLGDMSFFKKYSDLFFKRLPAGVKFVWVIGNHDKKIPWEIRNSYDIDIEITTLTEIKIGKKTVVLCHYPMARWNKSHWNSWHLHGHLHYNQEYRELKSSGKILNVNCEFNDYKPWSEVDVSKFMETQSDNEDRIAD